MRLTLGSQNKNKVGLVTEDLFTKVQRSSHHLGTLTIYLLKNGLYLVGGLEHGLVFFHSIGNFIIPTDALRHFSEGLKPPTSFISFMNCGPFIITILYNHLESR